MWFIVPIKGAKIPQRQQHCGFKVPNLTRIGSFVVRIYLQLHCLAHFARGDHEDTGRCEQPNSGLPEARSLNELPKSDTSPISLGLSCPASSGASSNPGGRVEAEPCQIRLSVITGSSACADDDDREVDDAP